MNCSKALPLIQPAHVIVVKEIIVSSLRFQLKFANQEMLHIWIPSDEVNYLHCFLHNPSGLHLFAAHHTFVNETVKCISSGSSILNSAHRAPIFADHGGSTICDDKVDFIGQAMLFK